MFLAFQKSIFSLAFVCVILVLVFYNQTSEILDFFALHPQNFNYSYSAFTSPWLHGNLDHLIGNLLSLISLSAIFMLLFPTNWLRFFISQYILSSVLFFFYCHTQYPTYWGFCLGLCFCILYTNHNTITTQ